VSGGDATSACVCSITYDYYSLPFCEPQQKVYQAQGWEKSLAGERTVTTPYVLEFLSSGYFEACTKKLTRQDVAKFRKAIALQYYFQVSCDLCLVSHSLVDAVRYASLVMVLLRHWSDVFGAHHFMPFAIRNRAILVLCSSVLFNGCSEWLLNRSGTSICLCFANLWSGLRLRACPPALGGFSQALEACKSHGV
jgi:hypothetical protein